MDTSKVMFFYPAMGVEWDANNLRAMPQPGLVYNVTRGDEYLDLAFCMGLKLSQEGNYHTIISLYRPDGSEVNSPDRYKKEDGFLIASHVQQLSHHNLITVKTKTRFDMVDGDGFYSSILSINKGLQSTEDSEIEVVATCQSYFYISGTGGVKI